MILQISTTGTPHQIGLKHGQLASKHITRAILFYTTLFSTKAKMDWPTVKQFALKYHPYLSQHWPQYVEEMKGVAEGAEVTYEDILALNVRTEIAFGAFSDGCTALSWKDGERSLLGQNWDWDVDQAENLICLKIQKQDGLTIQMITEAGIIGKVGFNSQGVGCTLNALKAKGVSFDKLPCHLALRTVMESPSQEAAISTLEKCGVASACHILVADVTGGTGMECSNLDIVQLPMDDRGRVTHTNHMIAPHIEGVVEEPDWLPDTRHRLKRINQLCGDEKGEPSMEVVGRLLEDDLEGEGASICRRQGKDGLATLFSVVMDLGGRKAGVRIGRPRDAEEVLGLDLSRCRI